MGVSTFEAVAVAVTNGIVLGTLFSLPHFSPFVATYYQWTPPFLLRLSFANFGLFMLSGVISELAKTFGNPENIKFLTMVGYGLFTASLLALGWEQHSGDVFATLLALMYTGGGWYFWTTVPKLTVDFSKVTLACLSFSSLYHLLLLPYLYRLLHDPSTPNPDPMVEQFRVTSSNYPYRFSLAYQQMALLALPMLLLSFRNETKIVMEQGGKTETSIEPTLGTKPKSSRNMFNFGSKNKEKQEESEEPFVGGKMKGVLLALPSMDWKQASANVSLMLFSTVYFAFLLALFPYLRTVNAEDGFSMICGLLVAAGSIVGSGVYLLLQSLGKGKSANPKPAFPTVAMYVLGFIPLGLWLSMANGSMVASGDALLTTCFFGGFCFHSLFFGRLAEKTSLLSFAAAMTPAPFILIAVAGDVGDKLNVQLPFPVLTIVLMVLYPISFLAFLITKYLK